MGSSVGGACGMEARAARVRGKGLAWGAGGSESQLTESGMLAGFLLYCAGHRSAERSSPCVFTFSGSAAWAALSSWRGRGDA